MRIGKYAICVLYASAFFLVGLPVVEVAPGGGLKVKVGVSEAQAAPRHVVRRTARRTTRRTVARLSVLPTGCDLSGLYWYCGGVYYQEIVENGVTVYIVVTP